MRQLNRFIVGLLLALVLAIVGVPAFAVDDSPEIQLALELAAEQPAIELVAVIDELVPGAVPAVDAERFERYSRVRPTVSYAVEPEPHFTHRARAVSGRAGGPWPRLQTT
jgi:hypothetical protein